MAPWSPGPIHPFGAEHAQGSNVCRVVPSTGGMSKNSSCNLILSIYLLSQGVTEDADTCVLQSFLEVGRLYKRWQGDRVGDLSQGLPSGGAHCPSQ